MRLKAKKNSLSQDQSTIQSVEEVLSKMNTTNIQNIETFFNTSPGNREINM